MRLIVPVSCDLPPSYAATAKKASMLYLRENRGDVVLLGLVFNISTNVKSAKRYTRCDLPYLGLDTTLFCFR